MFAILGLIFPVIKSFLGENLIEKMLVHRQARHTLAQHTRPSTTSSAIRMRSTNWQCVSTPTSAAGCARNC